MKVNLLLATAVVCLAMSPVSAETNQDEYAALFSSEQQVVEHGIVSDWIY